VTLSTAGATGAFAAKDVANGVAVNVTGLTIGGAQAGDYTLIQPTPTANITPATLTVNITAKDKAYDATKAVTLNLGNASLVGVLGNDSVALKTSGATGTFASKDTGSGIAVTVSGLTLTGAQAGDYTLTQPTTSANITPLALTVTGINRQRQGLRCDEQGDPEHGGRGPVRRARRRRGDPEHNGRHWRVLEPERRRQ